MQRLVRSGSSYISQDDKRQHFGLGKAAQADWVEVLWPDQTTTRLENVKANQVLEIVALNYSMLKSIWREMVVARRYLHDDHAQLVTPFREAFERHAVRLRQQLAVLALDRDRLRLRRRHECLALA
jgi:hypothetical protein